jgi:hypothetical protein
MCNDICLELNLTHTIDIAYQLLLVRLEPLYYLFSYKLISLCCCEVSTTCYSPNARVPTRGWHINNSYFHSTYFIFTTPRLWLRYGWITPVSRLEWEDSFERKFIGNLALGLLRDLSLMTPYCHFPFNS